MTARWYTEGLYDAITWCPDAAGLTDKQYILGLLRTVLTKYLDENSSPLGQFVLGVERGENMYSLEYAAVRKGANVYGLLSVAQHLLYQEAVSADYRVCSRILDALLREPCDPEGAAWVRAVNQIALDA